MEFQTLKKSYKKQIFIGALVVCVIGGALTFNLTRAKYKVTEEIPLVRGTVNYNVPDMRVVAINVSEDGTNYNIADEIPVGEYTLNTEKTTCKVATETSGIENAPKDNDITFEYVDNKINIRGVSKKNTRCYLYFDKLDTDKPVISSVSASSTQTSISVTVNASDNKGVTEYWYSINGGEYIKETTNTHTFGGLSASTSYTISVYTKDAAGNTSDIYTKTVATQAIPDTTSPTINSVTTSVTQNSITVNVSASDNKGVTEYLYSINGGTYTSKTTSSHTFTGLSSGTSYTIRVYVKDAAGNSSSVTTKSATTTPNGITMDDIIAGLNAKTTTPNFASAATTNEGVYSVSDGMYGGTSYYWRGAVTNNYVKFADLCWRIVRINGDKTMRLIYDGATCHANGTTGEMAVEHQAYNTSYDRSEYVGWTYSTNAQRTIGGTSSNAKSQTDTWFNGAITGSNANKVANGKFCNDRDTASGYSWSSQPSSIFYYAGYNRSGGRNATSVTPTLSCSSGDVYTLKVGTITMDEVIMAGAKYRTNNTSFYLYNGQIYWTMTPFYWDSNAVMFYVNESGYLSSNKVNWDGIYSPGIRPVINLKADTLFAIGGTGTQSNPYVVS